jgi:hypothetical protein
MRESEPSAGSELGRYLLLERVGPAAQRASAPRG